MSEKARSSVVAMALAGAALAGCTSGGESSEALVGAVDDVMEAARAAGFENPQLDVEIPVGDLLVVAISDLDSPRSTSGVYDGSMLTRDLDDALVLVFEDVDLTDPLLDPIWLSEVVATLAGGSPIIDAMVIDDLYPDDGVFLPRVNGDTLEFFMVRPAEGLATVRVTRTEAGAVDYGERDPFDD